MGLEFVLWGQGLGRGCQVVPALGLRGPGLGRKGLEIWLGVRRPKLETGC